MKFLHVSDLHIGKRLCERPLLEDQRHVLRQILEMAAAPETDAVLVAGDLYDKSQPSGEAVELASWFLSEIAALGNRRSSSAATTTRRSRWPTAAAFWPARTSTWHPQYPVRRSRLCSRTNAGR